MIVLRAPYLLFLGDIGDIGYVKTACGLRDWACERCAGQLRLPGGIDLGLPDLTPADAAARGAGTLVVGTALDGGAMPAAWQAALLQAIDAGLDIAAGLHQRLSTLPALASAARDRGVRLIDVRVPPTDIPVGTGRKRTGLRLLTVGTDCAIGKKYAALAIAQALQAAGGKATFRATGQTGILLAGSGMPIDAVVCDFVAGAAEMLSPDNEPDHWDIIEGQGALAHPSYAGVTTGLVHGSQPDAMVLCHEVGRDEIEGRPGFPTPSLQEAMDSYLRVARLTNRQTRFVAVSLNTARLPEAAAMEAIDTTARGIGLPCFDPLRTGVCGLVEVLQAWA
jgi:uncharacterized NAD-dependent epimerase/dehydratase family protein